MKQLLMLMLLAVATSAAAAEPKVQPPIIEELKPIGNRRVDNEVILRALKSKKGEPLSDATVTQDIHGIFDTNLFRDVVVRKKPGSEKNSVVLIYEVTEKPS